MKVLLINPPARRLAGIRNVYFPIGLGYLAASLEKAGFSAGLYNAENPKEELKELISGKYAALTSEYEKYSKALKDDSHFVWKEIRHTIQKFQPDAVCIRAATSNINCVQKIADIAKEYSKEFNKNGDNECDIIIGGPHATLAPGEALKYQNFDFVVRNEGEVTIVELCRLLEKGKSQVNKKNLEKINGLSFKDVKKTIKITHNKQRDFVKDINTLPFPARQLSLYPELYSKNDWGCIVGGRGCPFNCGFCSANLQWGRMLRLRSVDNVLEEIKLVIEKYGSNEFFFWDDTFTANRQRTMELCRSLLNEKIRISWSCTTRVNVIDDELLSLMKKAGCNRIDIGVESGSERMLKLINKRINLNQVETAVKQINKHRIMCNAFFMIGFPGLPVNIHTLSWLRSLRQDS
ncbi:MAG: radical SAM protein [Candidatus Woesearchaeota archaeon]|nr:radical SAM protein [Candidatus Woesearchaeota archaeon]